ARAFFRLHATQSRPMERDHALSRRQVGTPVFPESPRYTTRAVSPMRALDDYFVSLVQTNPGLRVRVGNPDELQRNRMSGTLRALGDSARQPAPAGWEAVAGPVLTALSEEAVIGAVGGTKGGLRLAVGCEAFAVTMLGALGQDILCARHQEEAGLPPAWLGV